MGSSPLWHILFWDENRRRLTTAMICRTARHHQVSSDFPAVPMGGRGRSVPAWTIIAAMQDCRMIRSSGSRHRWPGCAPSWQVSGCRSGPSAIVSPRVVWLVGGKAARAALSDSWRHGRLCGGWSV